ncbi:pyrimidine reductase [Sphaerisporangium rufum]|uniref:Pyrimidine reductase n=1 Tax=Sphaerisporangium rufum TaxID=1381558 RepID=A0A919R808_9ACTN|nr:dihydrofolate reductase family protein [Sphaerisporangium rufum]GII80943.1 pyrimidine reductase [Sphaerisporangium rufum]
MRKIITSTFVTLDGFIDDPHLWAMQYSDEQGQARSMALVQESDALLLGRVTYEGMAQAWPAMGGNPYADRVNSMPKYVVSSTLEKAEWENSTIIPGKDLVAEVTALKNQPGGDILVWGCGRLTDDLMAHGLLDEYLLWVYPVIKGGGERVFREGVQATLELTGNTTFSTGAILLAYRPLNATGEAPAAG